MAWEPTNANDVTFIVSLVDEDGDLIRSDSVVVDDFSIESDEDLELLSGVGNVKPKGVSRGDVEHGFSFTIQGEDADTFVDMASGEGDPTTDTGNDTKANELEITAMFQTVNIVLTGAYAGTRNVSGSSGDPTEGEFEGVATGRRTVYRNAGEAVDAVDAAGGGGA